MNHRYGSKLKRLDEPKQDLALELADGLFALLVIANEQDIDMSQALSRVLEKYRDRDGQRFVRKGES